MARITKAYINNVKNLIDKYNEYQRAFEIAENNITMLTQSTDFQFGIDNDTSQIDQNIIEGYEITNKTEEFRTIIEDAFLFNGYQITNNFVSALINSFYVVDTNLGELNLDINLTYDDYMDYARNNLRICSTFENRNTDISYTIKSGMLVEVASRLTGSAPFTSYDLMFIINSGHNGFTIHAKNNEEGFLAIGKSPYDPYDSSNTIIRDPNGDTSVNIPPKEGVMMFEKAKEFLEETVYEVFAKYLFYMNRAMNYKRLVEEALESFEPAINDIMTKINLIYKKFADMKIKK